MRSSLPLKKNPPNHLARDFVVAWRSINSLNALGCFAIDQASFKFIVESFEIFGIYCLFFFIFIFIYSLLDSDHITVVSASNALAPVLYGLRNVNNYWDYWIIHTEIIFFEIQQVSNVFRRHRTLKASKKMAISLLVRSS